VSTSVSDVKETGTFAGSALGRLALAVAVVASMTGAVIAGAIATAVQAGAVTCTGDMWTNTSGGSWDTGSNWSDSAPPTSSQTACITALGSYTVTIGNETISTGPLTVGAAGSTPTLIVGNTGSGEAEVTFASVSNSGTIEAGYDGTLTVPGLFTNTGTLEVGASPYDSTFALSDLDNQGSFDVDAALTYSLPTTGSTLLNDSTGTLSVASGQALDVTSPSGQTGTVTQDGIIDDAGSFTISDAFSVEGGSLCGPDVVHVGIDGNNAGPPSLGFASTVASGPTCGTGPTDQVFIANVTGTMSGNIPAAYTVVVGDGGSSFAKITSTTSTISGTFEPGYGATITSTAAITNDGTIEVPSSSYTTDLDLSHLTNHGNFDIEGPVNYSLPTTASTLLNGSTGTLSVASGQALAVTSPGGKTGTVTQDGVIDDAGSFTISDAFSVEGGSLCGPDVVHVGIDGNNAGPPSLGFASTVASGPTCGTGPTDQVFIANVTGALSGTIPSAYTVVIGDGGASFADITATTKKNLGTLEPGYGATVTFTSKLKNKGTFEVPASSFNTKINVGGNFTNKGSVILDGDGTISIKTGDTFTNSAHKTVSVASGITFDLTGPLSNSGTLSVGSSGAFDVSLTYTQASTGTYEPTLASTSSFGELNVTGTSSLAGTLAPQDAAGYTPPVNSTYEVVTSAGLAGTTYSSVTGSFTAQYINSDSDVQITAT
jgi:hypothetical protein